ncbi:hypothetical protein, partial [Pseudomonas viridiflava]
KYYGTPLLNLVEKIANTNKFWISRLELATDRNRMEDHEFISELIFVLAEDKLFGSNQQTIDAKYEKYSKKKVDWVSDIEPKFDLATTALQDLELDYENNRIGGVSHLFGLWSFIVDRVEQGKT